jgi:flagellar protein FliJ
VRKFTFGLQPVLDHRKRLEDEKQLILAEKKRAHDQALSELDRLNGEFRKHAEMLRLRHAELETGELQSLYAHLQFLDRCTVAQIRIVAERRVAVDRARADLLVASKEKKIVEKLKERRREAFVVEAQRVEQKELDDANARSWAHSHAGGTL